MLNLFDIPMHDREGFIEALEKLENLFQNKAVSEILEEIHTVLKFYSIPFGSIESVHRFCENAMREAMDAWLKDEKR